MWWYFANPITSLRDSSIIREREKVRELKEYMDGFKRGVVCFTVMVIIVGVLTCVEGRKPVLHRVGGAQQGWVPSMNFTNWTSHEQFYVGDGLYFGFNKRYYNVLEVSKTSYEKCIEKNFIKNITHGGQDMYNLTEAKPYYFLSGGGYCSHGMKLSVHVENITSAPPPPSLLESDSESKISSWINLAIVLSIVVVCYFLNHVCY